MSRKNNREKFRRIHQKNLTDDKKNIAKFEKALKKAIEGPTEPDNQQNEEEWEDAEENQMEVEDEVPKLKKIKKNKLIQKRTVKVEKKRLRKARKAPILVTHNEMNLE